VTIPARVSQVSAADTTEDCADANVVAVRTRRHSVVPSHCNCGAAGHHHCLYESQGAVAPQREQNLSLGRNSVEQFEQRAVDFTDSGFMVAPHFLQNLSSGIPSARQDGHVQPFCRNWRKREVRRATSIDGVFPGGAVCDALGLGATASGVCVTSARFTGGVEGVLAARRDFARRSSYSWRLSAPESKSLLMARMVSRICCERSGDVLAIALAWRLMRSMATSISWRAASEVRPRTVYQSLTISPER
jgi:hypothetical protein